MRHQSFSNTILFWRQPLTRAHQIPAESSTEVVEDAVAMGLSHLSVDVVAGVTQVSDLLGQQFDSLGGVAEDDALVDL